MTVTLVAVVLLAWVFSRRRAIRRWWRTKPCPHLDCPGRLPATPVHDWTGGGLRFWSERCVVCEGWVAWKPDEGRYVRVKASE